MRKILTVLLLMVLVQSVNGVNDGAPYLLLRWTWKQNAGNLERDIVFKLRASGTLATPPAGWPVVAVIGGGVREWRIGRDRPAEFFTLSVSNTVTGEEKFSVTP